MKLHYRYYIHWIQLWISVFTLMVLGFVPLVDAWRTDVTAPAWFSPNVFGRPAETLKETTLNTLTVRNRRIIAINGQSSAIDSVASENLMGRLHLLTGRRVQSWFGVETWLGKLAEGLFGLFFLLVGVGGIRKVYQARFAADFHKWSEDNDAEIPVFRIEEQQIRLLRPYPFAASQLAGRTQIAPHELTAIHDFGRKAILNGREVLFFTYKQRAELLGFSLRHGIPLFTFPDAWLTLSEPIYQPQDAELQEHNRLMLKWLNISPREAWQVRWILRCWRFFQPWYWPIYEEDDDPIFNHQTILYMTAAALVPRRRWYWYTMRLALYGSG